MTAGLDGGVGRVCRGLRERPRAQAPVPVGDERSLVPLCETARLAFSNNQHNSCCCSLIGECAIVAWGFAQPRIIIHPRATTHVIDAKSPILAMYLMYYLDESGTRVYTLSKTDLKGNPTFSAHPARFSPEDRVNKYRTSISHRKENV